MNETRESYIILSKTNDLLELSANYVHQLYPSFSVNYIKQKVMEREKVGSTYIGSGTILLHVISKKIMQEIGLYLFLLQKITWVSKFDQKKHKITKIIILCINPNHLRHNFAHLEWAIDHEFIKKQLSVESKELDVMHKI